jgi:hypothetical protein
LKAEISAQLANIWLALKRQDLPTWMTSKELAGYAGVASRTVRHHAKQLVDVGLLDMEDSTPRLYRLSDGAATRNPGMYQRLDRISAILKAHGEARTGRGDAP